MVTKVRTRRQMVLLSVAMLALGTGCSDDTSETSTSGSGGGNAGSSTSTTMPTVCDYPSPAMGVGVEVGQTLPQMLTWDGFPPGATTAEEVSITSLHDCDGTHGHHALLLSTLQPETAASGNHVAALRDALPSYAERGITVVFLLLNNPDGSEVTVDGAASWRQSFMIEDHAHVLTDTDFLLVSGGQVNTPQNTVVDPRTMTVVNITEGHPFDTAELEQLADTNAP